MGWRAWIRDRRRLKEEPEHLRTGRWGEKQAERFLRRQGFRILGRRVRVGRRDELDLIAREKDCLVFIEVKTRRSEVYGRPADAVNRKKRRTLSRAGIRYMIRRKEKPPKFRFDVVEVVGTMDEGVSEIRHIRKAFTLDPRYRIPW